MCVRNVEGLLKSVDRQQLSDVKPLADHHLHIQGPHATAEMRRLAERRPEVVAGLNPALLDPRSGEDAVAELDAAGIAQGVLLSEGYLFTSPLATADPDNPAGLTRLENAFNVEAALRSRGRLKAFIGVNPFAAGALNEIAYWTGRDGVTGIKLHLGNSGFDPMSDAHVGMLSRVFAAASAAALAVVVHVRGPGAQGVEAVRRFVRDVLSCADDNTVQIAHAGGGGGLDGEVIAALETYAEAIRQGRRGTARLIFDLSAVLVREPDEPEAAALLEGLADAGRRIGLERIVVGSDWPTLCSPGAHAALQRSQIPFTSTEWGKILANKAPYLD